MNNSDVPWFTGQLATPRGPVKVSWSLDVIPSPSCGAAWEASEPAIAYVNLSCAGGGTATGVQFASFGTPEGSCAAGWALGSCNANSSVAAVAAACVGKAACAVPVTDAVFGDPCPGTKKQLAAALACSGGPEPPSQQVLSLNVTVPVGATALLALPLLAGVAPGNASVTESGAAVWVKGAFVEGGAAGVVAGGALPGPLDGGRSAILALGFRVEGGGRYAFTISGT